METFKIQRSIATNAPAPMVLVYNKRRSIIGEIPLTDEMLELFGDEYKIYVRADFNEVTGNIEIDDYAETPSW